MTINSLLDILAKGMILLLSAGIFYYVVKIHISLKNMEKR
jgi:hypothetical protein